MLYNVYNLYTLYKLYTLCILCILYNFLPVLMHETPSLIFVRLPQQTLELTLFPSHPLRRNARIFSYNFVFF